MKLIMMYLRMNVKDMVFLAFLQYTNVPHREQRKVDNMICAR